MNRAHRLRGEMGFTITEALVTVLVFSFFLAVMFMTISYGFRTFSVAVARSDVTTEARRLVLFLEGELRSTAYFSLSVHQRQVSGEHRDGMCFVSMNDWSRVDSYNAIEDQPSWNRYIVYYATDHGVAGKLVRMVLNPPAAEVGSFPYGKFSSDQLLYMPTDPLDYDKTTDVTNVRVLATKVKSFEVKLLPVTQEVEVTTLLRQNGIMSRRGDRTREGGTFELKYIVTPQNTK
jgi:hypothetical protein